MYSIHSMSNFQILGYERKVWLGKMQFGFSLYLFLQERTSSARPG